MQNENKKAFGTHVFCMTTALRGPYLAVGRYTGLPAGRAWN